MVMTVRDDRLCWFQFADWVRVFVINSFKLIKVKVMKLRLCRNELVELYTNHNFELVVLHSFVRIKLHLYCIHFIYPQYTRVLILIL